MKQNMICNSVRFVTSTFIFVGIFISGPLFKAYGAPKTTKATAATPQKSVFQRGSFPKCFASAATHEACVTELNQIIDAGDFKESDLNDIRFNLKPGDTSNKVMMAAIAVIVSDVKNKNDSIGDIIIRSDLGKFSNDTLEKLTDYLLEESCSERSSDFGYHLYYVSGAAALTNNSMKKLGELLNEDCQHAIERPRHFEPVSGFLFESSESVREPLRSQIIRYYSKNRSIGGLPGESLDGRATIIEYHFHRSKYVHLDRPVSQEAVTRMNQIGISLNDQEFSDLIAIESDYSLKGVIEDRSIHTEILKEALNTYDRALIARQVMGRKIESNFRFAPVGGFVAGTGLTGASMLTRKKSFMSNIFTIAARRAKLFRIHKLPPEDAIRFASFIKAEITRRVQVFSERIKSDQVAIFFEEDLSQLLVDMRILRNMAPKSEDIRSFANLLAQSKQTPHPGSELGLVVALVGLYDSPMTMAQKFHVVRYIDGWKLGHKIDAYVYSLFLLKDDDPFNSLFQTEFKRVNGVDQFAKHQLFAALELFYGTMGLNEKVWDEGLQRDKRNEWYRAKIGALKAKGYVMPDIEIVD